MGLLLFLENKILYDNLFCRYLNIGEKYIILTRVCKKMGELNGNKYYTIGRIIYCNKNILYINKTLDILKYYRDNSIAIDHFYESTKNVIDSIIPNLNEKFKLWIKNGKLVEYKKISTNCDIIDNFIENYYYFNLKNKQDYRNFCNYIFYWLDYVKKVFNYKLEEIYSDTTINRAHVENWMKEAISKQSNENKVKNPEIKMSKNITSRMSKNKFKVKSL